MSERSVTSRRTRFLMDKQMDGQPVEWNSFFIDKPRKSFVKLRGKRKLTKETKKTAREMNFLGAVFSARLFLNFCDSNLQKFGEQITAPLDAGYLDAVERPSCNLRDTHAAPDAFPLEICHRIPLLDSVLDYASCRVFLECVRLRFQQGWNDRRGAIRLDQVSRNYGSWLTRELLNRRRKSPTGETVDLRAGSGRCETCVLVTGI